MNDSQNGPTPGFAERALAFGRDVYSGHGKIEILPKVSAATLDEMAVAYTPGVGYVVRHLLEHPENLSIQTTKDNMVALVTDGTAVLGLGNVGPWAGMPVMEGKAVMFKALAGIDCMPLSLNVKSPEQFCDVVAALEPTFGGINMEDVAAPHCFPILRDLEQRLSVPVIHDDQYGTATVAMAGLINAVKLTGRHLSDIRVVVNGVGAAGGATVNFLEALGVGDIIAVDRSGILQRGFDYPMAHWREIAARTNKDQRRGDLAAALKGADVFIGMSIGGLVSETMVTTMAKHPIVFALANPEPEISPDRALAAGAAIAASGRFDFPNHCNNVLAFPGLMRGALDTKAKRVTVSMCLAASRALASLAGDSIDEILPSPLDPAVHASVAEATAMQVVAEGLARRTVTEGQVKQHTLALIASVAERQANLGALTGLRTTSRVVFRDEN